jgi:hypothetical protein
MQLTALGLFIVGVAPLLWITTSVLGLGLPMLVYVLALQFPLLLIGAAMLLGSSPVKGLPPHALRWPLRAAAVVAMLGQLQVVLFTVLPPDIALPWIHDPWGIAAFCSALALLLWTLVTLPIVETMEASARHAAKGLGYTTASAIALLLLIYLTAGVAGAGCVMVLLALTGAVVATAYFWCVGRDLVT